MSRPGRDSFTVDGLMADHWPLIVQDFRSEHGVTLTGAYPWELFQTLLQGLLNADTRLSRALTPREANSDGR